MLWLLLGVLSYLSYSISTSIDKFLMIKGYNLLNVNTFKMFFDGIILLVIGLLFFDLNFTPRLILWSLILGGIYAIGGIVYYFSIKRKDLDIVIPYYQSSSILLTFIGSIILLKEVVNLHNYLGAGFILIGVYVVLSKDGFKFPKLDKIILLILTIIILNTGYSLFVKKLLYDIKPINLAIMMYFFSALIMSPFLLFSKKQNKLKDIKDIRIIAASFFGAMGTLLLYLALSVGNASKVYPLAGLESVFIFVISSIFFNKKFYWYRLIGTIIIFLGIYFISV